MTTKEQEANSTPDPNLPTDEEMDALFDKGLAVDVLNSAVESALHAANDLRSLTNFGNFFSFENEHGTLNINLSPEKT